MPLRLTDKRIERILREVHEREEAKRSLAGRIYPHLLKNNPKPDDQPKREPIQGWSHLRKK
jgi:hypothetical protein